MQNIQKGLKTSFPNIKPYSPFGQFPILPNSANYLRRLENLIVMSNHPYNGHNPGNNEMDPSKHHLNLVEKKKRKVRGTNKNPQQENLIFHLKLEEEKKGKKQKTSKAPVVQHTPAPQNQYYGAPLDSEQLYNIPITYPLQIEQSQPLILDGEYENSTIKTLLGKLENISSPSFLCCVDGCIIKANEAFAKLTGYTTEELESTLIQSLIHPDDKNSCNTVILQLLTTNSESVSHDVRYCDLQGQTFFSNQEILAIKNDHGNMQWLLYKLKNIDTLKEIVRPEQMTVQRCACGHRTIGMPLTIGENDQKFEDWMITTLDRLFHLDQPFCFIDKYAVIIWNNLAFDRLFGQSVPKQFISKKASEVEQMKGTAMEILAHSVLEDPPETLECQFYPQGRPGNITKKLAVKCLGQRVDKQENLLLGYLWSFELLDPTNQIESSQFVFREDLNL